MLARTGLIPAKNLLRSPVSWVPSLFLLVFPASGTNPALRQESLQPEIQPKHGQNPPLLYKV